MQHYKFIYLLVVLPFANLQTVNDYIENINDLYKNFLKYIPPDPYGYYYQKDFENQGIYGIYDFIIIGASTAGSVLANRLTENLNWKVLLVDCGGNDSYITDVPGLADLLQFSNYSFGFQSAPQTNAFQGLVNNTVYVLRGKGLGGTSTINYNNYIRGSLHACDYLAETGLSSWNSSVCLQYFKKGENATSISSSTLNSSCTLTSSEECDNVEYYKLDPGFHSTLGPMHVEPVGYFDNLAKTFMNAAMELNRKIIDYNGVSSVGYGMLQSNTNNGRRDSGNKAFLEPIRNRTNLFVLQGAFVTKLSFIPLTKICNGIQFVLGNKSYTALATKEVILSSDLVGSAQILMLSGIGPQEHLEELGIPVIQNLKVGMNLINYPYVPIPVQLKNPINLSNMTTLINQYLAGTGFLTTSTGSQAVGFINTRNSSANYPNIRQMFNIPYFGQDYGYNVNYLRYNNETFNAYFGKIKQNVVAFNIMHVQPKSRGQITLKSSSPFSSPNIDLNFFDDPEDVEDLIAGIKDFVNLTQTNAMKSYGISLPFNPLPACGSYIYWSDDYLRCLIKQVAYGSSYLGGACKMGPANDPTAVVDGDFKVYGVQNLRVIDESVVPELFGGAPNIMNSMFAERASDVIKQQYQIPDLI